MSEILRLMIYFVIGGAVMAGSVYYGAKGDGLLAAFITQFPSVTVLAFYLIYRNGGEPAVLSYAQGFIYTVPAWVLYVLVVYFLCARIGAIASLVLGVTLYMVASWALSLFQGAVSAQ